MRINRVELFRTGRWNNIKTFTVEDLDAMVSSFKDIGMSGRVPLKLGHNDKQEITDGQPAIGWLGALYREGEILFGDLIDVPRIVHDAIKAGAYKFVSVEMLRDVVFDGREFPWIMTAVSLLGADIPAVKSLKDLQALVMSRKGAPVLRSGERLTFTRGVKSTGVIETMADEKDKPDLTALIAKVDDLSSKVTTFSAENATLKADNERLKKEAKDRDDAAAKERVRVHRDAIKTRFDDAIGKKRILGSARNLFEKNPAFVSDEGVLALTLDFVDAYIKENTVSGWKEPKGGGEGGTDTRGDEPGEANLLPDAIVMKRTDKLVHESGGKLTYREANQRVLRADPALAEKYRMQPGIKGGATA